jgi:hypothetical protein
MAQEDDVEAIKRQLADLRRKVQTDHGDNHDPEKLVHRRKPAPPLAGQRGHARHVPPPGPPRKRRLYHPPVKQEPKLILCDARNLLIPVNLVLIAMVLSSMMETWRDVDVSVKIPSIFQPLLDTIITGSAAVDVDADVVPEDVDVLPPEIIFLDDSSTKLNPCRVVLENKGDTNYENMESVAMLYPLPFDTWDCSLPAIVDIALTKLYDRSDLMEGFENYFKEHLQGKVAVRPTDTKPIKYGELVDYRDYTYAYNAFVSVNCDGLSKWQMWLYQSPYRHCVMNALTKYREVDRDIRDRVCYTNPMVGQDFCWFIPSVMPQFPVKKNIISKPTLTICTGGNEGDHDLLANTLVTLELKNDVKIMVFDRRTINPQVIEADEKQKLSHLVTLVEGADYIGYQKRMSTCSVMIPLLDPERNPPYFGIGDKWWAGSVSQAIAYKIPTVAHADLERIYRKEWTAPVEIYNSDASLLQALNQTMEFVRRLCSSTGSCAYRA